MKIRILIFLGMAAVGAAVTWASQARTAVTQITPVEQKEAKPTLPLPRPMPTSADLIRLSRETMEKMLTPGTSIYSEELAGWSVDEIRAALNEALSNKEFLLDSSVASGLANNLLAEWMKRDCDGALQWYLTIAPPAIRMKMALSLSRNWPPDQPEKGLAFLKAHQELLPGGQGWAIIILNIVSRAKTGPAEVGSLLAELREAKIGLTFLNPITFPPNFDFPTLMAHPEMQGQKDKPIFNATLLQAWKAQNRDEAFDWLLKNWGLNALYVKQFYSSIEGVNKDDLEWLGERYQNLDPSQRSKVVSIMSSNWIRSPEIATSFIAGIRDPQIANEARELGVQLIFTGRIRDAVPFLAGISDPAKRLFILENAQPQGEVADNSSMRKFTPADEALLRKNLSEWNATAEQTEAIISKFKP